MGLNDLVDMSEYPFQALKDNTTEPIAIDTETLGYRKDLHTAFYYSWASRDLGVGAGPITTDKGWDFLKALCESKRPKVFHNLKFDIKAVKALGLKWDMNIEWHDTLLMHCLIDELHYGQHRLKTLSQEWLEHGRIDELEDYWKSKGLIGPKGKARRINPNVPQPLMHMYAKYDARDTLDLFHIFKGILQGTELWKHYRMCCDAELVYLRMEEEGIGVNVEVLMELIPQLQKARAKLVPALYETLNKGNVFNPASYQQLSIVLKHYGLPLWKKTDGGIFYATDKKILQSFVADPNIQNLIAWKFLNTALKDLVGYQIRLTERNRLHTSYRQTLVTGRTSSSDPNLMKIPQQQGRISEVDVGSAELATMCANAFRKVRAVIIPDKDSVLLARDYDQGEYRAFVHYSNSDHLRQRLIDGEDFHEIACKLVFGEHTKRLRHIIKIVNFGLIYGMGEELLKATIIAGDPKINPDDVLKRYQKFLPEMRDTQMAIIEQGRKRGYVRDVFNRRYHYQRQAPHKLVSYLCQGTVAGMKKISMARLRHIFEMVRSRIALDIHDELDFVMFKENAELFRNVQPIMEDFPQFGGIPMTTDCKGGFNLLDMVKMNTEEAIEFIRTHKFPERRAV